MNAGKSPAPGAAARAQAARAVDAVLSQGRSLDTALAEFEAPLTDPRDISLTRALAYGTLRMHLRNRAVLALLLDKPLRRRDRVVEALLSVALFALQSSRRPDYAVVSASVDAVRRVGKPAFAGLVNGVLRRFLREQDRLLAAVETDDEAHWLHPQWLLDRLRADWPENWESIVEAGNRPPPMWVRVNESRQPAADWLGRLPDGQSSAPIAALPGACLLTNPVAVEQLPGFAEGDCSVQDAASQYAAHLLAPRPGERLLDACAAPGGKAAHLLECAPDAELVALDMSRERLDRLTENLSRLSLNASVQVGDAADPGGWWDGKPFDGILLDAPCSATGVMRRHPDIRFLRRAADIDTLAATQTALLNNLWPLLRPGGRLLYATCSVLHAENEAIVSAFLATHDDAELLPVSKIDPALCLPSTAGAQLRPDACRNDGFYYALMARQPAP